VPAVVTTDPPVRTGKTVVSASVEVTPEDSVAELLRLEYGHESELPTAVVAFIGRMMEQQQAERETFLAALRVYKEETARLTLEVTGAREQLNNQIEAARDERERLTDQFLDRVDQLSAKISTSSSRYSAQLEEKDALLEDKERRVESYAGLAANAQSVIDDMRRSTSWRVTTPIRVMARLMARRSASGR
jgi:hypothetical protein